MEPMAVALPADTDESRRAVSERDAPLNPPVARWTPKNHHRTLSERMVRDVDSCLSPETTKGNWTRARILSSLNAFVKRWIQTTMDDRAIDDRYVMYTSGSYRLGIHETDADIDLLIVIHSELRDILHTRTFCTPGHSTHQDIPGARDIFFDHAETHLPTFLSAEHSAARIETIRQARVPIIALTVHTCSDPHHTEEEHPFDMTHELDILFATAAPHTSPDLPMKHFTLCDTALVNAAKRGDSATVASLGGPRVTNWIVENVPHFEPFSQALKVLRLWAKQRLIYGNKYGFLGGVNLAIMLAFVARLYPGMDDPSFLVHRFFALFAQWKWPNPLQLCAGADYRGVEPGWSPEAAPYDLMPVLTPTWPRSNSLASATHASVEVLKSEFVRGTTCALAQEDVSETVELLWAPRCPAVGFKRAIVIEAVRRTECDECDEDDECDKDGDEWFTNAIQWIDARSRMLNARLHQFHRRYLEHMSPVPGKIAIKEGEHYMWVVFFNIQVKRLDITKVSPEGRILARKPLDLAYGVEAFMQDLLKFWPGPDEESMRSRVRVVPMRVRDLHKKVKCKLNM